jgi:hypothetical protein
MCMYIKYMWIEKKGPVLFFPSPIEGLAGAFGLERQSSEGTTYVIHLRTRSLYVRYPPMTAKAARQAMMETNHA